MIIGAIRESSTTLFSLSGTHRHRLYGYISVSSFCIPDVQTTCRGRGPLASSGIIKQQLTRLTPGEHTLFIRSRQNPWSLTTARTFSLAGSLPLTWLYVNGKMDGNITMLSWGTTHEIDVEKFVVEHSVNGIRFEAVGQVSASNQAGDLQYSFTHERLAEGIHYYRIRQVDLNGHFSYSKVFLKNSFFNVDLV